MGYQRQYRGKIVSRPHSCVVIKANLSLEGETKRAREHISELRQRHPELAVLKCHCISLRGSNDYTLLWTPDPGSDG